MKMDDKLNAIIANSRTKVEFQGLELQAMVEVISYADLLYNIDRGKTSRKLLIHGRDEQQNEIVYSIYNLFVYLEAENYLKKQSDHFHDCLNVLVKEHGGKWILFEDGRIIYSGIAKEDLEAKIREKKDLDYYRPADFVVFVPLHVEDVQMETPAEPKSKAVITVTDIFRAATEREKLEIFKEICDLRIQSVGIEFPEE
jgi:NADH:ubiquinone oxidoreductase subunit C